MSIQRLSSSFLASGLVAALAGCSTALTVQTAANSGNASAGESGASIGSSAVISVQVNSDSSGSPVEGLGTTAGDGSAEITLPASWTFRQGFNVPPGGCLMTPTQFVNQGEGIYNIRVVPSLGNPACSWLSGDYHYSLQIEENQLEGSGLGVLTIP